MRANLLELINFAAVLRISYGQDKICFQHKNPCLRGT